MELTKKFMLALVLSAFAHPLLPTTIEACKKEKLADGKWQVTFTLKNAGKTSSGASSRSLETESEANDWIKNFCSSTELQETHDEV
jgi:ABC-type uncharacterized transport system substrate-binding protein